MTNYKAEFNPDLGIASLTDSTSGMVVRTLLPDPSRETASIQAYIGARFSRSDKSLIELAEETKVKGNPAERLEKIFEGYGHRSVGDQARIMVTLENIPDLEAMYILYLLPDYAAQQRSTRYQDFSSRSYIAPPENLNKEAFERRMEDQFKSYEVFTDLMSKHLRQEYPDASEQTIKARTFDASRGILPCGVLTNVAIYTSARNFSELIAELRASFFSVRREIGELLYKLLTGDCFSKEPTSIGDRIKQFFGEQRVYIPESKRLIRHAYPNNGSEVAKDWLVDEMIYRIYTYPDNLRNQMNQDLFVRLATSLNECAVQRVNALLNGMTYLKSYDEELAACVAEKILSFDDKTRIKNLGQIGAIEFDGITDIGSLRDINRHRSTKRFFPFLESTCWNPLYNCVTYRGSSDPFLKNPPKSKLLSYSSRIKSFIDSARAWREDLGHTSDRLRREKDGYAKYLVPLGADTRYFVGMSPDDLTYISHLRTRAGGHLSYRRLVHSWVKALTDKEPVYKVLLDILPEIDPEQDFNER